MEKILGLDLGTNSIGWAIIERISSININLIDKGVHIFQEGVKFEKGIESSKAADRTDYRALRKHYFRRKIRKVETLKVLSKLGFCPDLSAEQLKDWQTNGIYPMVDEFIVWQRTNEDHNPYYYRHLSVSQKLDLNSQINRYILGRAFYHIAQRRGFLSNRLETTKESEGNVNTSINELSKKIEVAGCRSLGEYFYKCYQSGEKIRNHYTSRDQHYRAEFNSICELQNISAENKKLLEKAIFFQRPLRSQKGLVGKCTFEKDKARCPISHPRFENYRMLCFLNNIKIQSPSDVVMRSLNVSERELIKPLFLRKSREHFDFEEIAKKLAKKNNYAYYKEPQGRPYLFNYKMTTTVSGSPVTAQLIDVFGEHWQSEIENRYTARNNKTTKEVVNDIWHVLFNFNDEKKLAEFATIKLQLEEKEAQNFSKIKLHQDYASLSLNAIDKILPFLEQGFIYSHSVFLANMGAILPKHIWDNKEDRKNIIAAVISEIDNYDIKSGITIHRQILNILRDNFELRPCAEQKLYHPSMIDTYPEVRAKVKEHWQLSSPRTNAIRNPMAMRTLFQLRHLINQLLKDGKIDPSTKINIELSRELNNANMRKAIELWQKEVEKENGEYSELIKQHLKLLNYKPSEDDVLKYRLWIEQNKTCLYTGKSIKISDFIGADPLFDIEHTIPRSIGGDNSQMNKTLADKHYNRDIKVAKMPSQLNDHQSILVRIEDWKAKTDELNKQIEDSKKRRNFSTKENKDKEIIKRNLLVIKRNYWQGKYERFVMEELKQGFRNSQGVDAGIISKYARLYLKSLFPKVYSIKGEMTAEFRRLWGLQDAYTPKERTNHIHHCIDAITIACIGKGENDKMSEYYRHEEDYRWFGNENKPRFEKPWETFTEDIKAIENEILISHYTADNLPKNTKKLERVRGKVVIDKNGKPIVKQGDTARGSLHQDTYYGAIMRNDVVKYVVRKSLNALKETEVEKIVDDVVREKVEEAVRKLGFKQAMVSDIWMNKEKGIAIKKVRCYTPSVTNPLHIRKHRDKSCFEYKQQCHVVNDSNYLIAIYEGLDKKGKIKCDSEIFNNINAANSLKRSADRIAFPDLVPKFKGELQLKCILKTGTMVIFWENSPEEVWELDKRDIKKRLYKVTQWSGKQITFRFHQEAKSAGELKAKDGKFQSQEEHRPLIRMYATGFNALVEGIDFELNILGEVKQLKR